MIKLNNNKLHPVTTAVWSEIVGDPRSNQDLVDLIEESAMTPEEKELIEQIPDKADITYVDAQISQVESQIPSLEGYATETWVESQGYLTEHQDITGKADITYVDSEISRVEGEIPSLEGYATETWVEGQGYLTEHQSIKTINSQSLIGTGNIEIGGLTPEEKALVEQIPDKADISYVDAQISDVREDIPSLEGYATETWVEGQGYLTEHQDITGKADISYVDAQISQVESQIPSLEGYATQSWVSSQGYLTEHQSLAGYATESWVNNQGFLTEHQDITGKADISYVDAQISDVRDDIPSLEGYATETWVEGQGYLTEHQSIKTINSQSLIGTGDIVIEGGDTDEIESVIGDGFAYLNQKVDDNYENLNGQFSGVRNYSQGLVNQEKIRIDRELEKSDSITAAGIYYSVKTEDDTVKNIIAISQTDYDDIEEKDPKTLYIITE